MVMKRLAMKNVTIRTEKQEEMRKQIMKTYKDSHHKKSFYSNVDSSRGSPLNIDSTKPPVAPKIRDDYLETLLNAIAICNTVIPVNPMSNNEDRILESCSPDEIAMVEFLE
jgi:magnesium-transporting ATPase (P-type)